MVFLRFCVGRRPVDRLAGAVLATTGQMAYNQVLPGKYNTNVALQASSGLLRPSTTDNTDIPKVKREAMIRNWYNQNPHSALKTKREITKYINWRQFTKGTRGGKPNEQLFPKSVVIQLPKIYKICH